MAAGGGAQRRPVAARNDGQRKWRSVAARSGGRWRGATTSSGGAQWPDPTPMPPSGPYRRVEEPFTASTVPEYGTNLLAEVKTSPVDSRRDHTGRVPQYGAKYGLEERECKGREGGNSSAASASAGTTRKKADGYRPGTTEEREMVKTCR